MYNYNNNSVHKCVKKFRHLEVLRHLEEYRKKKQDSTDNCIYLHAGSGQSLQASLLHLRATYDVNLTVYIDTRISNFHITPMRHYSKWNKLLLL